MVDRGCVEMRRLSYFSLTLYFQAKSKRRIVLGLREVTKHLKLRKIRCVIISPNLERIQSKGGLPDNLAKSDIFLTV